MQQADPQPPETAALALFEHGLGLYPAMERYLVAMHLPPEAAAGVVLAAQMYQELQRRCREQWALLRLPGAAAKLIQSKNELTPWQIQESGRFAISNGLPLDCIYAMVTRTRFVNNILSGGYRLKAQADPRILKAAGAVDTQAGIMDVSQAIPGSATGAKIQQSVPWVRITYKVTFWNGEEYIGVGMSDGNDEQVNQRGTSIMPSLAETRAANHAYRAALRLSSTAEEAQEEE